MSKSTGRMPSTLGPRFGAVQSENGTYRGVIYGVHVDGTPDLIDARRPTYGEAVADAYGASHLYGNHWEGRGETPWLRRAKQIYFR